VVPEKGP